MHTGVDSFKHPDRLIVTPALRNDEGPAADGADALVDGTEVRVAVE